MTILYEDNHLIAVNKTCNEIVQGDKTGDKPLVEMVKDYLREKYDKKGNVFCGVCHRLDRPVSGVVVFAKTSKALARFNDMLKNREVGKHYWAVVKKAPPEDTMTLRNYLKRNEKQNKSYVYDKQVDGAKEAVLSFRTLAKGDNYRLLEVDLQTGRHHQIRSQLAHIGCPIKGDLKYGAERSNKNGGISLHARQVEFVHPVSKEKITITAPVPQDDKLWKDLEMAAEK